MIGVLRQAVLRYSDELSPLVRVILVMNWAAAIWALSSLPSPGGPATFLSSLLLNTGHVFLFGGLAALLHMVGPSREPEAAIRAIGITAVWAVLDEWHQGFVPGRVASAWDVLSDLSGAVLFTAIVSYLRGAVPPWPRRGMLIGVPLAAVAVTAATIF